MSLSVRRGGVGWEPGRALVRAGFLCLVATGCATDPPPALLTLVDPETLTIQDSELLADSAKAAIRSYLGRIDDSVWLSASDPELDELVGRHRGLTALLNPDALPGPGRSSNVVIDVPGAGLTEFRLSHVRTDTSTTPTYTGQAKHGAISILLLRDSLVAGRITTDSAVYNFRSGAFGFINVAPADRSGKLPELHLIRSTADNVGRTHHTDGE
ncbi:MAG: hypothetical protein KFH98_12450 [Gemmatimonadetes bacterium]|nr:hypothetical protein [Gemmatimonadota bacterium]